VEVWAPPNENDTEAYARTVAKASGFGIDEPLDLHDYACLKPILTAMIRVENGRQPYSDAQIDAALVRAGVMPPQRSLQQTRTVKGGQVDAAGNYRRRGHRRHSGDDRPGARRSRRRRTVPRRGEMGAARGHADRGIGIMLWARIDDRRMGLR
jgi:hypothetical protein